MVRVARARRALLGLAAAGVCVAAGRVVWVLLLTTLDAYLTHHANHSDHHHSGDLSTINKPALSTRSPVEGDEGQKIVLFWTTWFGKAWWVRVGGGEDLQEARCPESRCVFTHDRSRVQEASALLFQVRRQLRTLHRCHYLDIISLYSFD